MNIKSITPKQSLNKAYRKATVFREEFESFRNNLTTLFENIDHEEREDNHKIHLKNFLDDTYYKGKHLINSKNSTDLVIYLENKQSSNAGVMLEVKRPTNKSEMISSEDINRKALHELVLYYLQERIERKNDEIKYLIATNIYEWFIFDAVAFENLFYKNKKLIEDYTKWKTDQKVSGSTDHFYKEIIKPFLAELPVEIPCTYLNLEKYKKLIHKTDDATEEKFIPLYKILSPVHLLKQPFANDSNSLDRNFYNELLHIIGLEEVKEKNKKIINRKSSSSRDPGSFIENTIQILKVDGALDRIKKPDKFGNNEGEQLYHIALELSLTWINRILFLKLLESQLYNYHKNDDYKFLNIKTISDFDELYKLFHSVLAVKEKDRVGKIKTKYAKVPYLNSSLFEITELENQALRINQLDDSLTIAVYKSSKLDKKKNEKLNTLQYLFEFLDAYNFTSEGKEKIEEEKKSLINASVLGLIFEKINGYKDGSYFTPGFITMYMCRETIRRAVIQKFNEKYNWNCETFDDLKNHLAGKRNTKDIIEANEVINSLKICDPAVGSGHFLVSALNEIITIKSELGILADDKGVLLSGYEVRIENDELIITYNYGEDIFEYHPPKSNKDKANESQRVQEILFTQKQTIIENCLFGVDINPNSVKIAQLRLWIELLKNAYYTKESGYTELETLPNIDINIKEGNSLVSKFDIQQDIFSLSDRKILDVYKINVGLYKNEHDRDKRKELKKSIESTKERIRGFAVDPLKKENEKIEKIFDQIQKLSSDNLFDAEMSKEEKEKREKKREELFAKHKKAVEERNKKAEEYKALYSNAFEWRFEFPEVLDDDGNFVGFDVVIGNPPYIPLEELSEFHREFYREKYIQFERKFETSVLFIVRSLELLNSVGSVTFIAPVTWQTGENYNNFRQYLFDQKGVQKIINLPFNIFTDAYVETGIYFFTNYSTNVYKMFSFNKKDIIDTLERIDFANINCSLISPPKYKVILNPFVHKILDRLGHSKFTTLGAITISTQGLSGSSFKPASRANKNHFPFLNKGNVYNYTLQIFDTFETSLDDKSSLKVFYEANPKILIRRIVNRQDRLSVGYTEKRMVFKKDINPFIPIDDNYHPKYLLALLASKLISYIYLNISSIASKDDFRQTTLTELRELPIPKISLKEQDTFVIAADKILKVKMKNPNADTTELESKVDQMVYKLYGLTYEEIKVVEGDELV